MNIKLVVGLGNPGVEYDKTRHNAGAWFVESLLASTSSSLRAEKKFFGQYGQLTTANHLFHVLIPTTFMNHSGQALLAISQFFKITPEEMLVAHDELDLPVGVARLKKNGGHGGHNGLRDIIRCLGTQDFLRLRIGIGHPGDKRHVLDYVLGRPSISDGQKIHQAISDASFAMPFLLKGDVEGAMQYLHAIDK